MRPIYLDHQASTPLEPLALEAMLPWLSRPANPHASENADGREARDAVEGARASIAGALGAAPSDVIFTAGATEAANIVLRSFAGARGPIVTTAIEHACVADTAADMRRAGSKVAILPVDGEGIVQTDLLHDLLEEPVALVSCMAVNNEVGTVQPLDEIAAACRAAGVPLHTDAAQALGRIELRLGRHFDLATVSGHKVYGPQGIGAIVAGVSEQQRLRPLATGGGQERGLRPGTLPVAACVGFGVACEIAARRLEEDRRHAEQSRSAFLEALRLRCSDIVINGSLEARVPHNLSVAFPGVDAQELLASVPHLALSTGSACASGAIGTSRVLAAMDVAPVIADATIRVGFGRHTRINEAASAGRDLGDAVRRLLVRRRA